MKPAFQILGVTAKPARPTWQAALLLATLLSIPFAGLAVIELTLL